MSSRTRAWCSKGEEKKKNLVSAASFGGLDIKTKEAGRLEKEIGGHDMTSVV